MENELTQLKKFKMVERGEEKNVLIFFIDMLIFVYLQEIFLQMYVYYKGCDHFIKFTSC